MNDELNCRSCKGKCNGKGKPSVSKYSAFCESQRNVAITDRLKFWQFTNNKLKKLINLLKGKDEKLKGFR